MLQVYSGTYGAVNVPSYGSGTYGSDTLSRSYGGPSYGSGTYGSDTRSRSYGSSTYGDVGDRGYGGYGRRRALLQDLSATALYGNYGTGGYGGGAGMTLGAYAGYGGQTRGYGYSGERMLQGAEFKPPGDIRPALYGVYGQGTTQGRGYGVNTAFGYYAPGVGYGYGYGQ
jgi:hypothetical protein